jgi:hypothetical protein
MLWARVSQSAVSVPKALETTAIQGVLSSGFLNVVFRKIGNTLWKRDEPNTRPVPTQDNTVEANQCAFYKTRPLWPACAECKGILHGRTKPIYVYVNSKTMRNQQISLEQHFPKTSFPYYIQLFSLTHLLFIVWSNETKRNRRVTV